MIIDQIDDGAFQAGLCDSSWHSSYRMTTKSVVLPMEIFVTQHYVVADHGFRILIE